MLIAKSLSIGNEYSQFFLYDPSIGCYLNDIIDEHFDQGFGWWLPSSVTFFHIYGNADFIIDVYLNEPVQFAEDTVRAVQVPFRVYGDQGLTIENICAFKVINIPTGNYALIVEQGYSGHPLTYEEKEKTDIWCRLWFNQSSEPVEPKVLVQDAQLNPQYPLRLDGLENDE